MPVTREMKPRMVTGRKTRKVFREQEWEQSTGQVLDIPLRWVPSALVGEGVEAWGWRLCARLSTWDTMLFRGLSGNLHLVQPWSDGEQTWGWALVEHLPRGGQRVVVRGQSPVSELVAEAWVVVVGGQIAGPKYARGGMLYPNPGDAYLAQARLEVGDRARSRVVKVMVGEVCDAHDLLSAP